MSLRRVLISDPIDPACVKVLQESGVEVTALTKVPAKEELIRMVKDFDGLIVRSGTKVTKDVIDGSGLKIIGRAGTGVDNINVEAATENGTLVMNTPGGNTMSAAEHTCAMMMALIRDIPAACASLKAGKWDRKSFMGQEMGGKTLGLVGLGRVGREVATRMQAFGMKVIGYDPYVSPSVAAASNIEFLPLEVMWGKVDWISIHTPLLPSTRHMISDAVFGKCKPGVRIVNVARGGIIDDAALLRALDSGVVAGVAIDVFESEPPKTDDEWKIINHPKSIVTPHLGASTKEAQLRVAEEIGQQFVDMAQGRPLVGLVNGVHLAQANTATNKPWLDLTLKLGRIAGVIGQVSASSSVSVAINGTHLKSLEKLLSSAAAVGVFNDPKINLLTASKVLNKVAVVVKDTTEEGSVTITVDKVEVSGGVDGSSAVLLSLNGQSLGGGGLRLADIHALNAYKKEQFAKASGTLSSLSWMSRTSDLVLTSSDPKDNFKGETGCYTVRF